MWRGGLSAEERPTILKNHSAEVTGLSLQATGDFFVSCARDGTWCFYDLTTARLVQTVNAGLKGEGCSGE